MEQELRKTKFRHKLEYLMFAVLAVVAEGNTFPKEEDKENFVKVTDQKVIKEVNRILEEFERIKQRENTESSFALVVYFEHFGVSVILKEDKSNPVPKAILIKSDIA